jgi:hypothetical protein
MKPALVVDEGVPVPKRKYLPRTVAGDAAMRLEIGDSVFCNAAQRETVRQAIYKLGGVPLQRIEFRDGVKGWRVWRVA